MCIYITVWRVEGGTFTAYIQIWLLVDIGLNEKHTSFLSVTIDFEDPEEFSP